MSKMTDLCKKAAIASKAFTATDAQTKNNMLDVMAEAIIVNADKIKDANLIDIENANKNNKDKTFIDRLTLSDKRITAMSNGIRAIIKLKDPVGEVVNTYSLNNGLKVQRVRAPLGVIGIIYEARPNVTIDCAALTIKSGNAVILRGSKDAINSNRALYTIICKALTKKGYCSDIVQFIDDESRDSTYDLLQQARYVDVIIPRGGDNLKNWVLSNAKMPVIASAGGNCHTYIEKSADIDIANQIVYNAKLSRPSVCNALEQLIVDEDIAKAFLPKCFNNLRKAGVRILGCDKTYEIDNNIERATNDDYYEEHLQYKISVKIVKDIKEAINWINEHNTKHSECIVTKDDKSAKLFTSMIDAAAIYVNASTRFTDGFELGLGAEMGISTQKLHVRGPIGLRELTSVKYVISGNGQIRE